MENHLLELQTALLPKYLERNGRITNIRSKPLTTAGENYGSVLLAVEIEISTETDKKTVHFLAKTVPKNDFIKQFFSSQATFKKELGFYDSIVPALKYFQKEQGVEHCIECVADFYGGRLGIDKNSDKFDEHAIILMENLKMEGYGTVSRKVGFELNTAKLILKNLAVLHAVPIGLKLLRPEEFQTNVKPYLNHVGLFTQFDADMGKKIVEDIVSVLKENPKYHQYIKQVVKKCTEGGSLASNPNKPKEPFATITHNDFWVNNIMIRKKEDAKEEKVKIIDFQFTDYGSPAKDLLFFIFDSCQNDVILRHFDEMIETYHASFMLTLEELKVNVIPFTMDKFLQEIEHSVKHTLVIFQCLIMLRPIFAEKDGVNEVENLTAENIISFREPSKEHKEKLYVMVEEFAKKKWL